MSQSLAALLLFLPAGIANMSPVFANKIPVLKDWKTPLDLGQSYQGKRLFGNNKTWRGLVFGVMVAGLAGYLEFQLLFKNAPPLSGGAVFYIIIAMLMGAGALLGDAVESFFKRQANVEPGHSWFPFDQLDYIIGGLLLSWPVMLWSFSQVISILVIYFGLHLAVSYLGFRLKLKDKPI